MKHLLVLLVTVIMCSPFSAARALEAVDPPLPQEQAAEDFGRSMAKTMLDMFDHLLAQARMAILGESAPLPHQECTCTCPCANDQKTI